MTLQAGRETLQQRRTDFVDAGAASGAFEVLREAAKALREKVVATGALRDEGRSFGIENNQPLDAARTFLNSNETQTWVLDSQWVAGSWLTLTIEKRRDIVKSKFTVTLTDG